jgi:hypothetical protein
MGGNLRWGLIGLDGKWAVEPVYREIRQMNEGLAAVMADKPPLWGYINLAGDWVIEPKYESAWDFTGGVAGVQTGGKYGLINKKGEWVKKPEFEYIELFLDGMALAKIKGDKEGQERAGCIDTKGDWVIPPDYADIFTFIYGGYTTATKYDPSKPDGMGRPGWIDRKGRFYAEDPEPGKARGFSTSAHYDMGLTPAKDDKTGLMGYKDKNGGWAIGPAFDSLDFFQQNGVARALKDYQLGLIDKEGAWIFGPMDCIIEDFEDDLAVVVVGHEKQGLIDSSGKWVRHPQYDSVYVIRNVSYQD